MARNTRQMKILDLITKKSIETQEELARELVIAGFEVTQATVSRDIKELGLVKVSEGKSQRYVRETSADKNFLNNLANVYRNAVIMIEQAQNIVVIKTIPGGAATVGMTVDRLKDGLILGCVAGDDTVFAVTKDNNAAELAVKRLTDMLN